MTASLTFVGHATFEFRSQNKRLLLDPFVTGNQASAFQVEDFRGVDYIVVSHSAWDHMGDTALLARDGETIVVCPPDVALLLEEQGVPRSRIKSATYGKSIPLGPFHVQVVECRHISFSSKARLTGIPLSFVIYTEPELGVYASTDTCLFSDLRLIGELYKPTIGLIHMGTFEGKYPTLSPREGVLMTKWLGLRAVVPCHYVSSSLEPDQFRIALREDLPEVMYHPMVPGETRSLNDLLDQR